MNITNKETNIRITAVSLSETMQVKRQRNDIFKVLKEKKNLKFYSQQICLSKMKQHEDVVDNENSRRPAQKNKENSLNSCEVPDRYLDLHEGMERARK